MADNPTTNPVSELLPITDQDHVRGGEHAAVTLVEFGDYECPGCGEAYLAIKCIESEMGDALRFVFRHFPYSRLHPHAELAAQAAEAAGAQGRFWEIHDLLFENQEALEFDDLVGYAKRLSLDLKQFRDDLKSEKYLERVRGDFRSGVQNGVFGTPTIFLNGIRHNGEADYETLSAAIARLREEDTPQAGITEE
ncbi:MAG TPA: thioredoxin domain-containing protein [Bryobacteraceae bacterium]|nr:thioredoxin domain-containing protein [Bryobacteraceae bacterium]